ncbi:homocysteine S-methyltransferase [Girardinichthys multiradiatus]|uniref:homocysteine S-methyltransferase n=1 Tax=Girardinichthys multiradiatus TaxID=208333 RepID=UPI001FACF61F|nr:homocysteine S-methyltransferase [Girardinichthys multiradiatus]XP_047230325.1 homocysteine S-methyltransferase [Girardinichthys multiradiatus]
MSSSDCLNRLLSNGPLILDGGLATELEAQGAKLQGDPLWSARLLHTNPQAIKEAHYRFLLGGADVTTTATYQASIQGFMDHLDVSSERARELLMSGVQVAKETVETFAPGERNLLVAGSVGPYGAFLHDGSEFTGAYAQKKSVEELRLWHKAQVDCLVAAGADLIAFETIPSIKEAQAIVELLKEYPDCRAWLAFSCKDVKHISDGSLFRDAVEMACRSPQMFAVGVNCCHPAVVEPLLDSGREALGANMSWVVYPNSGETWDSKNGWQKSEQTAGWMPELSHTWLKQGAALLGGCCRISPAHITALRLQLKRSSTSSSD